MGLVSFSLVSRLSSLCRVEVYNLVFPRADVNYGGSSGYGRKYMYAFAHR